MNNHYEVGDLLIYRGYDGDLVFCVSHVGAEGVLAIQLHRGVIGLMEQYIKFSKLENMFHSVFHTKDKERYTKFLSNWSSKE